jgi:hypothetical protein
LQPGGHLAQRFTAPLLKRDRDPIGAVGRLEHRVDHEVLVPDAKRLELARCPIGFTQRGAIRTRDEHDDRVLSIAQGCDRRGESRLLHLQPRVWAQARGALRGRL